MKHPPSACLLRALAPWLISPAPCFTLRPSFALLRYAILVHTLSGPNVSQCLHPHALAVIKPPPSEWATVYRAALQHCVRVGGVRTSPPCDSMFYDHTLQQRRKKYAVRLARAGNVSTPFVKVQKRSRRVAPDAFMPQTTISLPFRVPSPVVDTSSTTTGQGDRVPRSSAASPLEFELQPRQLSHHRVRRPLEQIWGTARPLSLRQCHRLTLQETRAQPVLFLFDQLFASCLRIPHQSMRKRAVRQAYWLFRQQVQSRCAGMRVA